MPRLSSISFLSSILARGGPIVHFHSVPSGGTSFTLKIKMLAKIGGGGPGSAPASLPSIERQEVSRVPCALNR